MDNDKYADLWFCQDCTIMHCNGDGSGMDEATAAAVSDGFESLQFEYSHVSYHSGGPAEGEDSDDSGEQEFSWAACDCCHTDLGGPRIRFAGWFRGV